MTDSASSLLPCVVFFNINGSGLGHLSRCLAYARRLQGRARCVFFSLASAVEIIHDMGFEGDYFVSHFWSRSHINAWNRELAVRFGLMLEEVQPDAVVFDGTWPFHGFMDACNIYGVPIRIWSNRGLHKEDFPPVPIKESAFDLVIRPGEIGEEFAILQADRPGRQVKTAPVTILRNDELLDRAAARSSLGLAPDARYALLSLGPGNLKDISAITQGLIDELRVRGFRIIWPRTPITVADTPVPDDVISVSAYPLVRYMRAFDLIVGAAGYNTCCEVLQAGVRSLLVPNTLVADDQARRAEAMTSHIPVIVSPCETRADQRDAIARLIELPGESMQDHGINLDGAERAAEEILSLVSRKVAA